MDGAERGGQVLAAGAHGLAEPGGERYLHRVRGRAEGFSGDDRNGVSQHGSAALHSAPGARIAGLRELEATQGSGQRPAPGVSVGDGV